MTPLSVLLVDADQNGLETLTYGFEREGASVNATSDLTAAPKLVGAAAPHLVVVNLREPEIPAGIGVIRLMRTGGYAVPHVAILALGPAVGIVVDADSYRAAWTEALRPVEQDGMSPVTVLRDYHAENVMLVDGLEGIGRFGLLDWHPDSLSHRVCQVLAAHEQDPHEPRDTTLVHRDIGHPRANVNERFRVALHAQMVWVRQRANDRE